MLFKNVFTICCVFSLMLTSCSNIYTVEDIVAVDRIRVEGGEEYRYIGVTPLEKGDYYYEKSIEFHKSLVLNKKIRIEKDAGIPDGVYVFVKNATEDSKETLVNVEILLFGRSRLEPKDMDRYKQSHKQQYLDKIQNAEEVAKENKHGVWEREP